MPKYSESCVRNFQPPATISKHRYSPYDPIVPGTGTGAWLRITSKPTSTAGDPKTARQSSGDSLGSTTPTTSTLGDLAEACEMVKLLEEIRELGAKIIVRDQDIEGFEKLLEDALAIV